MATKYTLQQIKDIIAMHEETMMKFFNSTIERFESKIDVLTQENHTLKKEIQELQASASFQNEHIEEIKKKVNDTKQDEINNKLSELEDRSRRNNLRVNGLEEDDEENWEESERKVKELFKEQLGVNNVVIERAHRSGRKKRDDGSRNKKRTVIVKFNSFKDKNLVLERFRSKKLWEKHIFINEDFSERTVILRKNLFKEVKELKERGINAKVIYNKIVYDNKRNNSANEIE